MQALLSNEFVVLAIDALLHVASVFVLGFAVIIACKLLTKGFVDAKLLTGLTIATLLVILRVFLLNNVHHVLGDFEVVVSMAVIGLVLFLASLVLVYKLVSIPLLGAILSSLVIVAAQLALAHYTPILSRTLMPEGQRFAEYAGASNERTKQLMAMAESYQGKSKSNIGKALKRALGTLAFWSSEEQQKILSKDLASGVEFIQERRAFMASMSEDELAEYRAAMSSFMQAQGVDLENRYSLENLKNASPEDLENLANFMKDMNQIHGFTDDLPHGTASGEKDVPPTLESIRQIAKNLKGVKIGEENSKQFAGLLKNIMAGEEFESGMVEVRGQIADLKTNSGEMVETFRQAEPEAMRQDLESVVGRGNPGPNLPAYPGNRVDYYVPLNTYNDFPEPPADNNPATPPAHPEQTAAAQEDTSEYFPESALSKSLTKDYVLRAPKSPGKRSRWTKMANTIRIGAWFEGKGAEDEGTVFIDGIAYRSGEAIKRRHQGEQYLFRFDGVQDGQVVITSLKREVIEPTD